MSRISFFKVALFYNRFLHDFYENRAHLKTASYAEQHRALMDTRFAWSDYWKTHLEASGHYQVTEILYNAPYLQKAWARENGFQFHEDRWQVEIVLEQLRRSGAGVFFSNEGWFQQFSSVQLKALFPQLFIIGYDGTAINSEKVFLGCDLMAANTPGSLDYYEKSGKKTYLYKLGFETSILEKIHYNESAERPYDVTIVGGVSIAKNVHVRRVKLLYYLSKHIKLNLFLMEPTIKDLISYWLNLARNRNGIGDYIELAKNTLYLSKLHRLNAGPIFGVDMYAALAKSKIALNVHIDSTGDSAANMRLFEATGVGSCLVTDWKSNIGELFDVGQEVVVYKSFEECLEKIRDLLKNEAMRKQIAANGFRRTNSGHNLKSQVVKFGDYLLPVLES
jgi:hypothetical protein